MSSGFNFHGRPPLRPQARAAFSPALVRSRMIERSKWTKPPKMWKNSSPAPVVVWIASVSERKPMPRTCSWSVTSISCFIKRAKRSSFQTTRVSPVHR